MYKINHVRHGCYEVLLETKSKTLYLTNFRNKKAVEAFIKQHKKGLIETGVTLMQDYLIIVEPNSINIGKEFNNYVYADKGSKLYVDDWNHANMDRDWET